MTIMSAFTFDTTQPMKSKLIDLLTTMTATMRLTKWNSKMKLRVGMATSAEKETTKETTKDLEEENVLDLTIEYLYPPRSV